jgi:hypothetical protein
MTDINPRQEIAQVSTSYTPSKVTKMKNVGHIRC